MLKKFKSIFGSEKKEGNAVKASKPNSKAKLKNEKKTKATATAIAPISKKGEKNQSSKVMQKKQKEELTNKERKDSNSKIKNESVLKSKEEIKETWPNKIKAMIIVELMGAPKEHIENTMQLYLEKIAESDVMIIDEQYVSDVEKKDSFFLQFSELTITFKNVKMLIDFCFDYMPSSIEIIEPDSVNYNSHDFSTIINDLQAKLHQLDMVVKNLRAENKIINENGNLLLRNLVLVALKEEKSLKELSHVTGINEDALENYLLDYCANNLVEEKNGKYKTKKQNKI